MRVDTTPGARRLDAGFTDARALCKGACATVATPGFFVPQRDEFREEEFAARIALLADGRGKYLLAERNGVVIGHGCIWPMPRANIAHLVRLHICVSPCFTDHGVG